jgi:hypothetical protein
MELVRAIPLLAFLAALMMAALLVLSSYGLGVVPAAQAATQAAPTAAPVAVPAGDSLGTVGALEGVLEQVYSQVNPSVVNIQVSQTAQPAARSSRMRPALRSNSQHRRGLKPNRRWALALSGTKRVTS